MSPRTGNPRRHGRPPYRVVLVHGGPGTPGTLAPVARELASWVGLLEPWQTASTVVGQVEELGQQISDSTTPPVTLVGHSWGAWLSVLLAAQQPEKVRRLVLVGSGPFRARYAREIRARRMLRLRPDEWDELERTLRVVSRPPRNPASMAVRRIEKLVELADSYELLPHRPGTVRFDPRMYQKIWPEAEKMRATGALAGALRRIQAPVLVLHGANDPHPVRGVVDPLRAAGVNVRVVLFRRCGHTPWWERYARDAFLRALRKELARDPSVSR